MPKSDKAKQASKSGDKEFYMELEFRSAPYTSASLFEGNFKIGQLTLVRCEESRRFVQEMQRLGLLKIRE